MKVLGTGFALDESLRMADKHRATVLSDSEWNERGKIFKKRGRGIRKDSLLNSIKIVCPENEKQIAFPWSNSPTRPQTVCVFTLRRRSRRDFLKNRFKKEILAFF